MPKFPHLKTDSNFESEFQNIKVQSERGKSGRSKWAESKVDGLNVGQCSRSGSSDRVFEPIYDVKVTTNANSN